MGGVGGSSVGAERLRISWLALRWTGQWGNPRWFESNTVDFDEIDAGRIARKYGLRGYDAVHLSSAAMMASVPTGPEIVFSSFDGALNRAAAGEKLPVLTCG